MPRTVEVELSESTRVRELCDAIGSASRDADVLLRFMRDLLSFKEMQDFSNRWAAAKMLMGGSTQSATAQELGMSTKTVNEVAMWVSGPFSTGGYWQVFQDLHGAERGARRAK